MKMNQQFLSILLSFSLLLAPLTLDACKNSDKASASGQPAPSSAQAQQAEQTQQAQQAPATTDANPTPDELYQLVAPIALFPDNLVAQVLAGSTYPDQITAANTWLQQNSSLKGDALCAGCGQAVVGRQRESPDAISRCAQSDGHQSVVDFRAGRRLLQHPARRDECGAGHAPARAAGRQSEKQSAAERDRRKSGAGTAPPPPPPSGSTRRAAADVIVQAPPQTIIIQPAQPTVVYVPTYNPDGRLRRPRAGLSGIFHRRRGRRQHDLFRRGHRRRRGHRQR